MKLLQFLPRSNKQQTTTKGKTWSRGTHSRLLYAVKVTKILSIAYIIRRLHDYLRSD